MPKVSDKNPVGMRWLHPFAIVVIQSSEKEVRGLYRVHQFTKALRPNRWVYEGGSQIYSALSYHYESRSVLCSGAPLSFAFRLTYL